jgi:2'-5' RNA ligase
MPDKNRYFIGIIPPSPIYEQAIEFKYYFKDHFQSKAAFHSPPHITLHMPFDWKDKQEGELIDSLQKFSLSLASVPVTLTNFGSFPPKTIFIQVGASNELVQLQLQVRQHCKKVLGLFNADYKDLPFHPHLTIAFRDLKKPMFTKAWAEFKDKPFDGTFSADRIALLKHDGEKWNLFEEFPLGKTGNN